MRQPVTVISTITPNRKPNRNNKSGYKGVYWSKSKQRWEAKIGFRGKSISLGSFPNKEDAIAARLEAEDEYYRPMIEEYLAAMKDDSIHPHIQYE